MLQICNRCLESACPTPIIQIFRWVILPFAGFSLQLSWIWVQNITYIRNTGWYKRNDFAAPFFHLLILSPCPQTGCLVWVNSTLLSFYHKLMVLHVEISKYNSLPPIFCYLCMYILRAILLVLIRRFICEIIFLHVQRITKMLKLFNLP